jgi:hypothetical protein
MNQSPRKFNGMDSNVMPVSVSVKQLSTSLRKFNFLPTPFVHDAAKVNQFTKFCESLGFSRREAECQVKSEQDYLARTATNGSNGSKSDSKLPR